MDIVFLDANVLFSAAHKHDANFLRLWRMNLRLVSSLYAAGEARRNLKRPQQRERLADLLQSVELVPETPDGGFAEEINLPEKDAPILSGAIAVRATHLLTGDARHFGRYYGTVVQGVLILSPAAYFLTRPL